VHFGLYQPAPVMKILSYKMRV